MIAAFPLCPESYIAQITGILAHPGSNVAELTRIVEQMRAAWQSIVALTAGSYQPKFQV